MTTMVMVMLPMNNTSETDVAPWAGLDWMNWVGSLGGVKYRALYGANEVAIVMVAKVTNGDGDTPIQRTCLSDGWAVGQTA